MQASLRSSDLGLLKRVRHAGLPPGIGRALPYCLPALAAAVATGRWFRGTSFIATGDVAPFLRTNLSAELSTMWGHALSGAGSASFQPTARVPELLTLRIASLFGGSPEAAQRIFYTGLAVAAVLSVVWFAGAFVGGGMGRTAAGLVAFFNPFVLQHVPNPLPLWTMAMMGASGALLVRTARGAHPPGIALAAVSVCGAYLAVNPPLLAMVGVWVLLLAAIAPLLGGRGAARRTWGLVGRALPWAVLLNLWWVVPYATTLGSQGTGYTIAAQTDVASWSWTQARLSLANVASLDGHWGWSYPEYFPYAASVDGSIWGPLRFGLPALSFASVFLAPVGRRRIAAAFAGTALILILLAKGLHSPFTGLNLFLYNQVPGMWLLREPLSKLGPMLVILYAAMIAMAVEGVRELVRTVPSRSRIALVSIVAILGIGAMGFAYPMWTGAVIPDDRPVLPAAHVQVPQGWFQVADALNNAPNRGKALVLPLDGFYQMPTTWGYYGVDQIPRSLLTRPTIAPLPDSYYGDLPAFAGPVSAVQTALETGDLAAVPRLLRALGVSYVIVRHDLSTSFPHRHVAAWAPLDAGLRATDGLTPDGSYDVADVYRFDGSGAGADPFISAISHPFAAGEVSPTDLSSAVASMPAGAGIVTGAPGQPNPSVSVIGAQDARATVDGADGPLELSTRLLGPQLLRVHAHRGRDLVVARATTVDLDGRALAASDVAHVAIGAPTVAAVGTSEGMVPMRAGTAIVAARAQDHLSAYAAGAPLPWSGSWTHVQDCHAFDARTPAQAGLSATAISGAAPGVMLVAGAHAACVHATVHADDANGGPMLLRFQERTLLGRPARACLWVEASATCAPMASVPQRHQWYSFAATVQHPAGAGSMELFLYADAGASGAAPTRTAYRGMSLAPLHLVAQRPLVVAPPADHRVPVGNGRHALSLGTAGAARLGSFSDQVGDCHNYDARSLTQAAIAAEPLPGEPQPAIRLDAASHTACVSAPVESFIPGGTYTLSLDQRTVSGLPARVCLWEEGPDRCASLPPIEDSSTWSAVRATVTPDAGTQALRLFLYADAARIGGTSSTVDYRGVTLRPAPPVSVTVLPVSRPVATPPVSWTRTGEASYQVDVDAGSEPFILAMDESFSPGWRLSGLPQGAATPVMVNGYAQGWSITPSGPFTARITFGPDAWFHRAVDVSALTAVAAPFILVRRRRRSRRGAARGPEGDGPDDRVHLPLPPQNDGGASLVVAPWGTSWW